ncbi:MAG: NAD(P)/FAD-dependent oxidoreductase [Anaerolineae bacterium]|nr:NAD(P)/FAD-dependent oxidoreductase [Anaerolineae bacterium]
MASDQQLTVCVIGAGLSGLSAAYDLGRQGYRVVVLESESFIGGLASSVEVDERPIERFYHFICGDDHDLIDLVDELGLGDKLHWEPSKTKFYYNGKLYGFGTPFDLLRFSAVPFLQRIRFGLNVIASRYTNSWEKLDKVGAKSWLIQQIGQQAYNVIWDPLLRVKFGEYHDRVSAAWIWHRIYRVAKSRRRLWEPEYFGYLERGSETVIEALAEKLRGMPNAELRTNARVKQIHSANGRVTGITLINGDEHIPCDAVVSTVALPVLLKVTPDLPSSYREKLSQVDYLGVVCGLLKLKQPITQSFWVNINDPNIPFNGIIEYSNLNKHMNLGGKSVAYIPYYLRTSAPRYSYSDERLMDEFIDGIHRVNPDFDPSWIEEWHISRAPYAQAICTVGFADLVPDHQTPLTGLYITDSTQFYPEDRTISAAIRMGRRVAGMIIEKSS